MSSSSRTTRVPPDRFRWDAEEGAAADLRRIILAATEADGRSPVNEATLLALRHRGLEGSQLWLAPDGGGFALAAAHPGQVQLSLVVHPAHRGRGVGRALAEQAVAAPSRERLTAWSHGNHPAAAALAGRLGFTKVRDLWVMRRTLADPLPEVTTPAGVVVRPFRPGRDEEAFLAVNATAFADHPEQGSLTRADLAQRAGEPWFDAEGLLLAERTGDRPEMLGFHWTKVHPGDPAYGEVYVLGVAPAAQGLGLGRVLTLAGLHHLRDRGLGEVILYVESENAPAIAVYRGLGFTHADADTDVMYARDAEAPVT